MNRKIRIWTGPFLALCMFMLILDTKTAIEGASQGVMLCIKTVIPSLFPFFVLSSIIMPGLTGKKAVLLRPIGKFCGIPSGSESLLILGLVGGYPVGAQCINDACKSGSISRACSHRLLAFCNNVGPSFIFGIGSSLFHSAVPIWTTWIIQIFSAVIVGWITSRTSEPSANISKAVPLSFAQALEKGIHNISTVCGWVILFRVILTILHRWVLWLLPNHFQILLTGLFELSNGCVELARIDNLGLRFILFNIFLSFGGICVAMQTVSATQDTGIGMYFPGKLMQSSFVTIMSILIQPLLFPAHERFHFSPVCLIILTLFTGLLTFNLRRSKKTVAFSR